MAPLPLHSVSSHALPSLHPAPVAVQRKLLMLLAPFLRRWTYARSPEHISGGHKYLPPRQVSTWGLQEGWLILLGLRRPPPPLPSWRRSRPERVSNPIQVLH